MKKTLLIYTSLFLFSGQLLAQDSITSVASSSPQFRPLKTSDEVLPPWSLDVFYRFGSVKNDITMVDLSQSYLQSLNSKFSKPTLESGSVAHYAGIQVGYFFGKKRHFGIGTGFTLGRQKGSMSIDSFKTEYKSVDNNNETFRQILRNGGITEDFVSSTVTIPLLLKFKQQFNNSRLGLAVDAGALFGIINSNKLTTLSAKFDYEAIYKYDASNNMGVYDNSNPYDATSQLVTKDFWSNHQTSDLTVEDYFIRKRGEGMNVGLNEELSAKNTKTKYSAVPSLGFIIQPSVTYQLGNKGGKDESNTFIVLGGFYSYQVYKNKSNQDYRLTDKIGEYNSIIGGIKNNVVTNWGVQIGLRYFFGESRDIDGDKVPDKIDNCWKLYGDPSFGGCPDFDKDGVQDDKDECWDEYGIVNGCPDADDDGIADKDDDCPNESGPASNLPELNGCSEIKQLKALYKKVRKEEMPESNQGSVNKEKSDEDYVVIMQRNIITFSSGKHEVLPSNFSVLDDAVKALGEKPELMIIINGHTDSIGAANLNYDLSINRAEAVSQYLQSQGVNKDRILTRGYGKDKPYTSNSNEESRSMNRRTEMLLVKPIKIKQ